MKQEFLGCCCLASVKWVEWLMWRVWACSSCSLMFGISHRRAWSPAASLVSTNHGAFLIFTMLERFLGQGSTSGCCYGFFLGACGPSFGPSRASEQSMAHELPVSIHLCRRFQEFFPLHRWSFILVKDSGTALQSSSLFGQSERKKSGRKCRGRDAAKMQLKKTPSGQFGKLFIV
jgi:hypothetical protein